MKNECIPNQHNRNSEVCDHKRWPKFEQHREATENDLSDDTRDESKRKPREVSTARCSNEGTEHCEDDGHGDKTGDGSVYELDHGVVLERRDDLIFFAGWPVGASESRTGQSDGGAADGDEHLREQGHKGDAPVGPRGESRQPHDVDGTGVDSTFPNPSGSVT